MRGKPDNVSPTRIIKLDAWPPASLHKPAPMGAGYVKDQSAISEWDRLCSQIAQQWRGAAVRQACISIRFKGAKSQLEMARLGNSVVLMLQRAYVLSSTRPDCIKRITIIPQRAPVTSVEIKIRPLVKRPAPEMTRQSMMRVFKVRGVAQEELAHEIGVSRPFLSMWFSGRKESKHVEEEVRKRLRIAASVRVTSGYAGISKAARKPLAVNE